MACMSTIWSAVLYLVCLFFSFFMQNWILRYTQCCIQMFFWHTVFLKLSIGQFSDTQNPPVVVPEECPKIFDIQCAWGRIFVSLEKIFVCKYCRLYFIYFLLEICIEKTLHKLLWAVFLGTHTIQTVPKYIWMQHWHLQIFLSTWFKIFFS